MKRLEWFGLLLVGLCTEAVAEDIDPDAQEVLWSLAGEVCHDPYAFTLVPGVFHGHTLADNKWFYGPHLDSPRAGGIRVISWKKWGQFGGTIDRRRRSTTNVIVYCRALGADVVPNGISVVRRSRALIAHVGKSSDGVRADIWRHRSVEFCVIGERAALIRRRDVGRVSLVVSAPGTALLIDVAGGRRLWKSLCVDD